MMRLEMLLIWVVVGGLVGVLADAIIGGVKLGAAGAVTVGMLGGLVGGVVTFSVLHVPPRMELMGSIAAAVAGAVLLPLILRVFKYR